MLVHFLTVSMVLRYWCKDCVISKYFWSLFQLMKADATTFKLCMAQTLVMQRGADVWVMRMWRARFSCSTALWEKVDIEIYTIAMHSVDNRCNVEQGFILIRRCYTSIGVDLIRQNSLLKIRRFNEHQQNNHTQGTSWLVKSSPRFNMKMMVERIINGLPHAG